MPAFHAMYGLKPPPSGSYLRGLVKPLGEIKKDTGKEVVMVLDNRTQLPEEIGVEAVSREMRKEFYHAGIPVYPSTERALRGIHHALVCRRPQAS